MKLIFNVVKYENLNTNNSEGDKKNNYKKKTSDNEKTNNLSDESFLNRYYKSLYEILLNKEVVNSKYLRDFLKLIIESLLFDTNSTRVTAFMKRLISVSYFAEPPFIACVLVIISQVLRNKNKLWKIIENPFNKINENVKIDHSKRDPQYTNADEFPLFEIYILLNHYHPTIQKFSRFIIENYKKETINYEGDPLLDFSLINFLEKFILKNPKIKSEKNAKKNTTEVDISNKEDEEFRRFIGEKVEKEDKDTENNKTSKGENFDFIKKFSELDKKTQKAKTKKLAKQTADKENIDIEDFADKVIENEYEKYEKLYGGDVDEDLDFNEDEL